MSEEPEIHRSRIDVGLSWLNAIPSLDKLRMAVRLSLECGEPKKVMTTEGDEAWEWTNPMDQSVTWIEVRTWVGCKPLHPVVEESINEIKRQLMK